MDKRGKSNNYGLYEIDAPLRNHIIGIGIDQYKFVNPNLNYCISEVEELGRILIEHYSFFEDDRFTRIFNNPMKQPTKRIVLDQIRDKITCLTSQDNVIIYFAGHGLSHEGMFYFAVYDSKENEYSAFISFKEIIKILERQKVKHFLFIIDACYSGKVLNIHRSLEEGGLEENSEFWKKIYLKKSIWVLTSGSMEKVPNKSIFADRMCKILESFGRNNKPILISELKNKIISHLGKDVKQTPVVGHLNIVEGFENIGGEFVFLPRRNELNENSNILNEIKSKTSFEKEKSAIENVIDAKNLKNKNEDLKNTKEPHNIENTEIPSVQTELKIDSNNSTNSNLDFENSIFENVSSNKRKKYSLAFATILLLLTLVFNSEGEGDREKKPPIIEEEIPISPYFQPSQMSVIPNFSPITKQSPENQTNDVVLSKSIKVIKPKIKIYPILKYEEDTISDKTNVVFSGSFENKENANRMLERLKEIGYEDAEIIMKENLPYAIVVSGFHNFKGDAKEELRKIRRKGIEVYGSEKYWNEIYRKIK